MPEVTFFVSRRVLIVFYFQTMPTVLTEHGLFTPPPSPDLPPARILHVRIRTTDDLPDVWITPVDDVSELDL
ncbi:hypothetical protein FRC06_009976 [Ceratobasidium sp. 370]|nr:hypothetical protein FRC06_009976 [Ceratobasidium sp. 370]